MWKVTPLKSCILAILEKRGGVLLENDLDNPLKEMYGDYGTDIINIDKIPTKMNQSIHIFNDLSHLEVSIFLLQVIW